MLYPLVTAWSHLLQEIALAWNRRRKNIHKIPSFYTSQNKARDFVRNRKLTDDEVQTAAVVFDVLARLDYKPDSFCVLNPTSPLRTPKLLVDAYLLFKNRDFPALISQPEMGGHDGTYIFAKTLAFLRAMCLLTIEGARWNKIPARFSSDINTQEDFDKALSLAENR